MNENIFYELKTNNPHILNKNDCLLLAHYLKQNIPIIVNISARVLDLECLNIIEKGLQQNNHVIAGVMSIENEPWGLPAELRLVYLIQRIMNKCRENMEYKLNLFKNKIPKLEDLCLKSININDIYKLKHLPRFHHYNEIVTLFSKLPDQTLYKYKY